MFNQRSNDTKLYDILGITKNDCDSNKLKKKYRKLAMKWHPDKNPNNKEAEQKFKEINHAYSILSDPDKKRIYDQFGEDGVKNSENNHQQNGNPFDFFSSVFGNSGHSFSTTFTNNSGRNNNKPELIVINVELCDFYIGKKITHKYNKKIMINSDGKEDNSGYINCNNCNGSGRVTTTRQIGPGFVQQTQTTCNICNGKGVSIKSDYKFKNNELNIEFNVEKGMKENQKVLIRNAGSYNPQLKKDDDLLIIIKEVNTKYKNFKREGDNLIYDFNINLYTALVGNNINIIRLDGKTLAIPLDSVIKPNSIYAIKNEGMPIMNTNKFGDLIIKFHVVFPEKLSIKQKNILRENFNFIGDPIPVGAKFCNLININNNNRDRDSNDQCVHQ